MTVQGPVKEQRPDGMSHRGGVIAETCSSVTGPETAGSGALTCDPSFLDRDPPGPTTHCRAGAARGIWALPFVSHVVLMTPSKH